MMKTYEMLILGAILIVVFVFLHESTHYTIDKEYGCKTSVFADWRGIGVEYWDCNTRQDPHLANAINEIVGYNIGVILTLSLFMQITRH
jgi:hypothetical protein